MKKKPVLLDGAVGTSLWEKADRDGIEKVPVWRYNIEHPELVVELAREFAEAGAEYVLTNTISANRPSIEGPTDYKTVDIVKRAVGLCKEGIKGTEAKSILAVGALTTLLEPFGTLKKEEAREIYAEQIGAGMEAGADAVLIQTFLDLEMMAIAAEEAVKYGKPVICTMTFEKHGRTLMGNKPEDVAKRLGEIGVTAVGLNCGLGPELALPIIKKFAEATDMPLAFKPNAGMPVVQDDGTVEIESDPVTFAKVVVQAAPYVDYIGGCCNCNAEYIRELKKQLEYKHLEYK